MRAYCNSFLAHFSLGYRDIGHQLGQRMEEMLTQILKIADVLYVFLSCFTFTFG